MYFCQVQCFGNVVNGVYYCNLNRCMSMKYRKYGTRILNLPIVKRLLFIMFVCLFPTVAMNAQDDKTSNQDAEAVENYTPETTNSLSMPSVGTSETDETITNLGEIDPAFSRNTEPTSGNIDVYSRNVDPFTEDYDTFTEDIALEDSLHLPLLNRYGQTSIGMYPLNWWGWYDWELQKGLNVSLGLNAFASFGRSPWRGTGFGENISVMYAVPLTDKLSIAVGGYFDNLYWSHDSYRDAGLNAVLGYKFNEHWEGYVYGQKSLVDKRMPMPFYDMSNIGDRIGAAIKYNFNPSFSIQLSVEANKYR